MHTTSDVGLESTGKAEYSLVVCESKGNEVQQGLIGWFKHLRIWRRTSRALQVLEWMEPWGSCYGLNQCIGCGLGKCEVWLWMLDWFQYIIDLGRLPVCRLVKIRVLNTGCADEATVHNFR